MDVMTPVRASLPLGRRRRMKPSLSLDILPKRCKLDVMTSIPSKTIAGFHHSSGKIRTIKPPELTSILESDRSSVLVLDCRPSAAFDMNRIKGAIHINIHQPGSWVTSDRPLTLAGLMSSDEGKKLSQTSVDQRIVIYDEHGVDPTSISIDSALYVVLNQLSKEDRDHNLSFLAGGLDEFYRHSRHLCDNSTTAILDHRPLYSPTTSLNQPEVETATASKILPYLFIGNERDAANLELLRELDITYVLNVSSHIPLYFENADIKYKRLPASDCGQQNLQIYFCEANDFIEEARESKAGVLVHCQAGVSRSPTITLAYLIQRASLSLVDAYKYVKARRPVVSPNLNFMGQLLEFEEKIRSLNLHREIINL